MILDNAKPVGHTGNKFAAFVTRFPCGDAYVQIYPRPSIFTIDFANPVAEYETLAKGAAASARRECKRLEAKGL